VKKWFQAFAFHKSNLYRYTAPLLEINDVPAIHYWVRALKDCPRLGPSNRTTHIVCNHDNVVGLYKLNAVDPYISFKRLVSTFELIK
jgi:hypothetical protein